MKEAISTQFPSFFSEYVVFLNAVVMSNSTFHRRLLQVLSVKREKQIGSTGLYICGEVEIERVVSANNVFISTAQSPTQDIVKDDPSKQSIWGNKS